MDVGEATWLRETTKATLYEVGGVARWAPKSQVVSGPTKGCPGRLVVVGWLAKRMRPLPPVYVGEGTLASALRPFARAAGMAMIDQLQQIWWKLGVSAEDFSRAAEASNAYDALVTLMGAQEKTQLRAAVTVKREPNQTPTLVIVVTSPGGDKEPMEELIEKLPTVLASLGIEADDASKWGEP